MNKFIFNGIAIEHIVKVNLKHSYISVSKESKVVLKTSKVSKSFINELLTSKELWIKKQLMKTKQNKPIKVNLTEEVLLFGKVYPIKEQEVRTLQELLLKLKNKTEEKVVKCYDNFYKQMASSYLTPRLKYFANKMNLNFNEVKYKKLKSRWGSCSNQKMITLNIQLLKVQKELIDYVIVHELAHLVYMNHSKEFHTLIEKYLKNSKLLRKKLKEINLA